MTDRQKQSHLGAVERETPAPPTTHYRKKPVVIEARQYTGRNGTALLGWVGGTELEEEFLGDAIEIKTLEGTMRADKGDWIIHGVKGEFYPCKPDIFEATYDPVPIDEAVDEPAGRGRT